MTILSLPAVGRVTERYLRQQHGQPIPRAQLVAWLESVDVAHERAHAGIRLAITIGRLVDTPRGLAISRVDAGEQERAA